MKNRWRCSQTMQTTAIAGRKEPTSSESALWQALRKLRSSGFIFRRQVPMGRFILDFYCPARKLAVEVDGSIHKRPEVFGRDSERAELLVTQFGIRIMRVRADEVMDDVDIVIENILKQI